MTDYTDTMANKGKLWIEIYHINTQKTVRFKAIMKGFSDTYNTSYDDHFFIGQTEPIKKWKSTVRQIDLEYVALANDYRQAKENLAKTSLLTSMLYPEQKRDGSGVITKVGGSPIFKVRLLNLIGAPGQPYDFALQSGLQGYISNFLFKMDMENGVFFHAPSLIENRGLGYADIGATADDAYSVYPQQINMSFTFFPVYERSPGWKTSGKSPAIFTVNKGAVGNYPYGVSTALGEATDVPRPAPIVNAPAGDPSPAPDGSDATKQAREAEKEVKKSKNAAFEAMMAADLEAINNSSATPATPASLTPEQEYNQQVYEENQAQRAEKRAVGARTQPGASTQTSAQQEAILAGLGAKDDVQRAAKIAAAEAREEQKEGFVSKTQTFEEQERRLNLAAVERDAEKERIAQLTAENLNEQEPDPRTVRARAELDAELKRRKHMDEIEEQKKAEQFAKIAAEEEKKKQAKLAQEQAFQKKKEETAKKIKEEEAKGKSLAKQGKVKLIKGQPYIEDKDGNLVHCNQVPGGCFD